MDKHPVTDFFTKARTLFRQPQGSSRRKINRSEPQRRLENVFASLAGAASQPVNPHTSSKVLNSENRRNRLAACQRELESMKAANRVLKRQLEQQELEERIKTENLRIWQVLAIKELEGRLEERAPTQCQQITEIETCLNDQYTAGAPKIMGAMDGTMQCLALFLTESLVKSMCQVIEETRELELALETYTAAKTEAGIGRDNIEYAKSMLEQAETKEQFEYFQETLKKNESQMLRDIKRRDTLRDDFQLKKLKFEHSQAVLLSVLEQVLREAQLMPETQEASHDEAQSFPDRDTVSEQTRSERAADDEEDFLDPEHEERHLAQLDLDAAHERLYYVRVHIDTLPSKHQEEIQNYRDKGGFEFPESELDVIHLSQKFEAARALIEAEEALELAEARARTVGIIGNLPDQTSHFLDLEEDGYVESEEPSEEPPMDLDFVKTWTEAVCEGPPDEHMDTEVDDWDMKTVVLGDSLSDVADLNGNRKYIDRWRFACDRAAQGELGGDPSAIMLQEYQA